MSTAETWNGGDCTVGDRDTSEGVLASLSWSLTGCLGGAE